MFHSFLPIQLRICIIQKYTYYHQYRQFLLNSFLVHVRNCFPSDSPSLSTADVVASFVYSTISIILLDYTRQKTRIIIKDKGKLGFNNSLFTGCVLQRQNGVYYGVFFVIFHTVILLVSTDASEIL